MFICIYSYTSIYMYVYICIDTCIYAYIHTCTYVYMHTYMYIHRNRPMGWLQSVGLIKSQVSFAEYHLFCKALLQKRPVFIDHTNSYWVATNHRIIHDSLMIH